MYIRFRRHCKRNKTTQHKPNRTMFQSNYGVFIGEALPREFKKKRDNSFEQLRPIKSFSFDNHCTLRIFNYYKLSEFSFPSIGVVVRWRRHGFSAIIDRNHLFFVSLLVRRVFFSFFFFFSIFHSFRSLVNGLHFAARIENFSKNI